MRIVEELLRAGHPPNLMTGQTGSAPLTVALLSVRSSGPGASAKPALLPFIRLLISRRLSDVNLCNSSGFTPLSVACGAGLTDIARELLAAGAHPDGSYGVLCSFPDAPSSALMTSGKQQKPSLDRARGVPLVMAVVNGHAEVVSMLLRGGANPLVCQYPGGTALYAAAERGNLHVMKLLLIHCAEREVTPSSLVRHETLSTSHLTAAAEAPAVAFNPGPSTSPPPLPPVLASPSVSLPALSFSEAMRDGLLDARCQSLRDPEQRPPLHAAAAGGHLEAVRMLLQAGADPNKRNHRCGNSILGLAAARGDLALARLLVDPVQPWFKSLKLNRKCWSLATPLCIASQYGHLDICALLLSHGCSVNKSDYQDLSPLHGAARAGHVEIVRLLLAHKAGKNARTLRGATSLLLAAQYGYTEVSKCGGRRISFITLSLGCAYAPASRFFRCNPQARWCFSTAVG
jgi:ankyrin repeat protein